MVVFGGGFASKRFTEPVFQVGRIGMSSGCLDLLPGFPREATSALAFSSALELEPSDTNEVVSGHREQELNADTNQPSESCLACSRDRLGPPEDLLDPLPLLLTHSVPAAACRAAVQNRCDSFLLSNVREHSLLGQSHLELAGVVRLVGSQSHSPTRSIHRSFHHRECRFRFRSPVRRRDLGVRAQSVAVLHQDMAEVAQLRRLPFRLPIELGLWIGRRAVRLVAALLTLEVHLWVSSATLWRVISALGAKALHRRASLDQSQVEGEVFIRQQLPPPSLFDDLLEEFPKQVPVQQSRPVLRERRRV